MRTLLRSIAPLVLLTAATVCGAQANTVTAQEQSQGWRLLWDGKDMAGWRTTAGAPVPEDSVSIQNGVLTLRETKNHAGDIVTDGIYSNFELVVDFNISVGGNSGIKYFINDAVNKAAGSVVGFEYQILDDNRHPDAKAGRDGDRKTASLYDMLPANTAGAYREPGQWNTARIVVRGTHAEHWLNGTKVLEYDRSTPAFKDAVAKSKFHNFAGFGQANDGHFLLQDHGDEVQFRNVKVRPLSGAAQ